MTYSRLAGLSILVFVWLIYTLVTAYDLSLNNLYSALCPFSFAWVALRYAWLVHITHSVTEGEDVFNLDPPLSSSMLLSTN